MSDLITNDRNDDVYIFSLLSTKLKYFVCADAQQDGTRVACKKSARTLSAALSKCSGGKENLSVFVVLQLFAFLLSDFSAGSRLKNVSD